MPQRRRGAAIPTKRYRGTTPVKRVYRGTVLVWRERYDLTLAGLAFSATSSGTWFTALTHVVTSPQGRGVLTASGHWGHIYANTIHDLAILVNGVQVAFATTPEDRVAKFHTVTAPERLLVAGDVVTVHIRTNSTTTDGRTFTPTLTSV